MVIESEVLKKFSDFLSQDNLLDPNHLTETALLSVTEAVKAERAGAQAWVLILRDIWEDFDT